MIGRLQQENVTVYYFPPGLRFETLTEGGAPGTAGLLYDESPLLDSDIARRVFFTSGRLRLPAALYWPDCRDLTIVDMLVARGADPTISMDGAVVCGYQRIHPDARDVRGRTGCTHRFWGLVWEHTLPVPGTTYLTTPPMRSLMHVRSAR